MGWAAAGVIVAALSAAAGAHQQSASSRKSIHAQEDIAARQTKALSLAPPTGPTTAELEAQRLAKEAEKAKATAEQRTSDLEAGIKADTDEAMKRRRSLVGLAATVKTSPAGLTGRAPTEKKSLLGQGGAY